MSSSRFAAIVELRAARQCEYCRMHQALQGATFHVEHVVPETHGGLTELANLAWACPGCNLHKSDRTELIDPETGQLVRMFHPREDNWTEHFQWNDVRLVPLTPVGRALLAALDLNHERRRRIRRAERLFGLFPPQTDVAT